MPQRQALSDNMRFEVQKKSMPLLKCWIWTPMPPRKCSNSDTLAAVYPPNTGWVFNSQCDHLSLLQLCYWIFLELMHTKPAQRVVMKMTVFLKKVVLILRVAAPHLLTIKVLVKVQDKGEKLLVWPLKATPCRQGRQCRPVLKAQGC